LDRAGEYEIDVIAGLACGDDALTARVTMHAGDRRDTAERVLWKPLEQRKGAQRDRRYRRRHGSPSPTSIRRSDDFSISGFLNVVLCTISRSRPKLNSDAAIVGFYRPDRRSVPGEPL